VYGNLLRADPALPEILSGIAGGSVQLCRRFNLTLPAARSDFAVSSVSGGKKNADAAAPALSFVFLYPDYSASLIAPVGQAASQAPQSTQVSASIT
jgi:hypothetical protein